MKPFDFSYLTQPVRDLHEMFRPFREFQERLLQLAKEIDENRPPLRFPNSMPYAERFWNKVDIREPDQCWDWLGAQLRGGYGSARAEDGRTISAHRQAYRLAGNDLPDDVLLLHSCDRPVCCNPGHHRPGTQLDNMEDAAKKLRMRHKRSPEEVRQIVIEWKGGASIQGLARKFGISATCVFKMVHGKVFRHLTADLLAAKEAA